MIQMIVMSPCAIDNVIYDIRLHQIADGALLLPFHSTHPQVFHQASLPNSTGGHFVDVGGHVSSYTLTSGMIILLVK